eukprot:scaffold651676_cov48-Prasinocladus_malaysianus.AAC.1
MAIWSNGLRYAPSPPSVAASLSGKPSTASSLAVTTSLVSSHRVCSRAAPCAGCSVTRQQSRSRRRAD